MKYNVGEDKKRGLYDASLKELWRKGKIAKIF